jgi:hypothetical protein
MFEIEGFEFINTVYGFWELLEPWASFLVEVVL